MDNNNFSVTLGLQGPRGLKGDKGDAGFIAFEIIGNELVITENVNDELTFVITNGCLFLEVN